MAHRDMQLVWEISSQPHDPDWDSYVAQSPYGHHEQTSRWGRLKAHYGWKPVRLKAVRNGELVAGVQVLLRRVGRLGRVGYVCKGPVFDLADVGLQHQVVNHLHHWAAKENLLYLVIELPYDGHALAEGLDAVGYGLHPEKLPPSGLMSATLIVDLHQDLQAMLANMNQSRRQRVRSSMKSGLSFREGNADEMSVFRELMLNVCSRRGVQPTPPQPDFFENLWKVFDGSGWMKLFLVERSGSPVHAMVTFPFGSWMRVWKIGSAVVSGQTNADEFDFWQAMCWAKSQGYRWFDFVWIDREAAIRYRNGERPSSSWMPGGMTLAKLAWGGEALILPLPRSRFYNPVLHTFARFGGYRLLNSPQFSRWAARWHRRE